MIRSDPSNAGPQNDSKESSHIFLPLQYLIRHQAQKILDILSTYIEIEREREKEREEKKERGCWA